MPWIVLAVIPSTLLVTGILVAFRRMELQREANVGQERARAKERGSHRARLQHPAIDLSRCIGCGLCVTACPEEQVLDLLHGQAVIVHGSRCVGHGRCAEACPVGAIALTLGDISERNDLPAITEEFEAIGTPNLFLAGEVTGYALVRTAIVHGTAVADEVRRRTDADSPRDTSSLDASVLDLAVVGAGPAGLACSLRAKELELDFVTIDQESIGGTVARYPRRKLVMTQPVSLPLVGKLKQTTFVKEDLIQLWEGVAANEKLPIRTGVTYRGLEQKDDGTFQVETSDGSIRARHVVLALGRRGSPRRLGVPGEDLPKVGYSLIDARSYKNRKILIVGGGDSAVEAAVGLSEQPGNDVTLSYRKGAFSRIKAANERNLEGAVRQGSIRTVLSSQVVSIRPKDVELVVEETGEDAGTGRIVIENDDVFIFAGGIPPFSLLESSGVSFAPEARIPVDPVRERGPGLLVALAGALLLSLGVVVWTAFHIDYYALSPVLRLDSASYEFLRASGPVGLLTGVVAVLAMVWNLAYLIRRARWGQWLPGSLSFWMSSHVLTGIVALLAVLVHSGFTFRASTGGHAFIAMSIVVAAGAIGRYLYSFVPRAANGRELELDEARVTLDQLSVEWEQRGSDFGRRVREEIESLLTRDRWQRTFLGRFIALVTSERRVRRALARLRAEGREQGYGDDDLDGWICLARRAHRGSLAVAHYEDLRALLSSWRYVHRWLALLLVLVVATHIVVAIRYADFALFSEGAP